MSYPLAALRTKTDLATPDDQWAVDQAPPVSGFATMPNGAWTHVLLGFEQVESDGEGGYTGPLADNDTTADVTIVQWRTSQDGEQVIGETETISAHPLRSLLTVFVPHGWSFTVQLSVVTDPHADADAVRIHWQPIVKPS